ncbi:MAG: hypothetical protein ABW217_03245 [Polyangiaceae bacterium]
MRALVASCLRHFWLAAGSTFLAACLGGWVRLLPWLSARALPLAALGPFVLELLFGALQAALVLGAPLAAALASALFVERGEARALFALGVSPTQCARTVMLALLGPVLALGLIVATFRSLHDDEPLALLSATSDAIREHCASAAEPVAVPIPGSDFSWLCGRPEAPLLVGPVPGSAALWLSGRTLERAGDRVSVQSAQLTSRAGELRLSGSADRFTVRGVGGGSGLPSLDLFLAALAGALLATLPIAHGILRRQRIPRWLPLLVGLSVGCGTLALITELAHSLTHEARARSLAVAIAAPVLSALVLHVLGDLVTYFARLRTRQRARQA